MTGRPGGLKHGDVCFVRSGEIRPALPGEWHCDPYSVLPEVYSRWQGPAATQSERSILVRHVWNQKARLWIARND
jgi:hypothetical protein